MNKFRRGQKVRFREEVTFEDMQKMKLQNRWGSWVVCRNEFTFEVVKYPIRSSYTECDILLDNNCFIGEEYLESAEPNRSHPLTNFFKNNA